MTDALVVSPRIRISREEFQFTFVRSSGPGGQNVNKVNTKAVLRWSVERTASLPEAVRARFLEKYRRRVTAEGDLVLTSQRYRDQRRNVEDCLEKLGAMVAEIAHPPKKRKPTRPTRAAQERRLKEKRARSESKRRRRDSRTND